MQVNLTPEIVRIAQARAESIGVDLATELARVALEEIIFQMDPEMNLIVDQSMSLNSIDFLASGLKVNDTVINGQRFEVRALDHNGSVTVPRYLANSQVTINGCFVIELKNNESARLVGYLSAGNLISSINYSEDKTLIVESVETSKPVDLTGIVNKACQRINIPLDKAVETRPQLDEIKQFVLNPLKVEYARQRDILTTLCLDTNCRESLMSLPAGPDGVSKGMVKKMLRSGSRWNRNTEDMAIDLVKKFDSLSQSEVKNTLVDLGETYGGQTLAPRFKKAAMKKLSIEHMSRSMEKEKFAKVKTIMDRVVDGVSLVDAIKEKVKNSVAVDLALAIKKNRKNVDSFVQASAEEIGMAFQQLAIQPAYATHSSSDDGVESINEALELLETCQFLEEMEV